MPAIENRQALRAIRKLFGKRAEVGARQHRGPEIADALAVNPVQPVHIVRLRLELAGKALADDGALLSRDRKEIGVRVGVDRAPERRVARGIAWPPARGRRTEAEFEAPAPEALHFADGMATQQPLGRL